MPMSDASGMKEALREVVSKEILVVVISQCGLNLLPNLLSPRPLRSVLTGYRCRTGRLPAIHPRSDASRYR